MNHHITHSTNTSNFSIRQNDFLQTPKYLNNAPFRPPKKPVKSKKSKITEKDTDIVLPNCLESSKSDTGSSCFQNKTDNTLLFSKSVIQESVKPWVEKSNITTFSKNLENNRRPIICTTKNTKRRYKKNKWRYIDILQAIVSKYKASYHRSITKVPKDVSKYKETQVRINLYEKSLSHKRTKRSKFGVANFVRLSIEKAPFMKRYQEIWSKEVFIIDVIVYGNPTTYKRKDQDDQPIKETMSKSFNLLWNPRRIALRKWFKRKRRVIV